MFEINGHTKQLGIIGYPVEHTFSPNMHNFISETVHNNYVYGAWCVKPEDLKDAETKISYLENLKTIAAGCSDADSFKSEVQKQYPEYSGENYLAMTAGFFFS